MNILDTILNELEMAKGHDVPYTYDRILQLKAIKEFCQYLDAYSRDRALEEYFGLKRDYEV